MNRELIIRVLEESESFRGYMADIFLAESESERDEVEDLIFQIDQVLRNEGKIHAIKLLRDKVEGDSDFIEDLCRRFCLENSSQAEFRLGLATAKKIVESL